MLSLSVFIRWKITTLPLLYLFFSQRWRHCSSHRICFYYRSGQVSLPASCQSSIHSPSSEARLSRVHLKEVKLARGTRGDQRIQDLQNDQKVHRSVSGPAVHEFHVIIPLGPVSQGGQGKERCEHPTSAGHKGSATRDGREDAIDAGLPKDFTTAMDIWNTAKLLPWCNIHCQ